MDTYTARENARVLAKHDLFYRSSRGRHNSGPFRRQLFYTRPLPTIPSLPPARPRPFPFARAVAGPPTRELCGLALRHGGSTGTGLSRRASRLPLLLPAAAVGSVRTPTSDEACTLACRKVVKIHRRERDIRCDSRRPRESVSIARGSLNSSSSSFLAIPSRDGTNRGNCESRSIPRKVVYVRAYARI